MNIQELIKGANLPPLPDVVIRLQELLDDNKSSLKDVSEVISLDPALTAKILKLANSAFFGFITKSTTVTQAISRIGAEATYSLALATSAADSIASVKIKDFDADDFWTRAVHTGIVAKNIKKLTVKKDAERLFVSGLLLNVGELICATKYPSEVGLLQSEEDYALAPWQAQKEVFGHTYYEISAALLKEWKIPKSVYMPIQELFKTKELHAAYLSSLDMVNSSYVDYSVLGYSAEESELIKGCIADANLESFSILEIINPGSTMIY